MTNEEKSIHKNKIIITFAVLALIFASVSYILVHSDVNNSLHFRYVINQRTGEPVGLIASMVVYVFFGCVASIWFSSIVILFMLGFWYFLHRKDKQILNRGYHPKYEEESEYGLMLSLRVAYVAVFLLVFLHAANIITIHL